jgi:hypothetical protein
MTQGGQIHGTFFLPWTAVIGSDIPHNANFLRGSVLFHLQGGHHLYGKFLGSQKHLKHAIDTSPIKKSAA